MIRNTFIWSIQLFVLMGTADLAKAATNANPLPFPQLKPAKTLTSAGPGIPRPVLNRSKQLLILSKEDASLYRAAFDAVKRRDYAVARSIANATDNPILKPVVDWAIATSPGNGGELAEAMQLHDDFRDWPKATTLAWRVEQRLARSYPRDFNLIGRWFEGHPPKSPAGMWVYADYLLEKQQFDDARFWISKAWRSGALERADERTIIATHGHRLSQDDHVARLDQALWNDRFATAKRQLNRVDGDYKALARARLALKTQSKLVDFRVRAVPAELRNDPGLAYDRIRWRRRKGKLDTALDLLINNPFQYAPASYQSPGYDYSSKLWKERRLLARWALRKGMADKAYRATVHHGLTSGVDFAEAEWFAGFIALAFLNDPATAYTHFTQLIEGVGKPISVSRAHYWAAEAARRSGDISSKVVMNHYRIAASHDAYFYGQLARDRLRGFDAGSDKVPPPAIAGPAFLPFERIVKALSDADQSKLARQFFQFMVPKAPSGSAIAETRALIDLAEAIDRPDLGLLLAKSQVGNFETKSFLADYAWPEIRLADLPSGLLWQAPSPALVHAVIRQESAFIPEVKSRVGARGYMQLMPATAMATAKLHGLGYSKTALTAEPHYNMTLGIAYLAEMLNRFDGATILALAAYNAGPHRVDRWLVDYGDPRTGRVDPINWIEQIPFSETRNYVQRVMEAYRVYATRFNSPQAAVPLRRLMLNHRAR